MTGTVARDVRADSVRLPGVAGGAVWLLRAEGVVDAPDHPLFTVVMRPPPGSRTVAVDLALVQLLSARGASGLLRCAGALADAGHTLCLAAAAPAIARVLELTGVAAHVRMVPTVEDVLSTCRPTRLVAVTGGGTAQTREPVTGALPPPDGEVTGRERRELEELRTEVRSLRAKSRTHPLIDQTMGVLQERYGLANPRAAFELLRESSQRHNVRMRHLAEAVLTTRPPGGEALATVAAQAREAAPPLSFLPGAAPGRATRGAVVRALLDTALEVTGTDMGNVQLVDQVTGGLRLEAHRGLSEEFVEFFDHVGAEGTSCSLAAEHVTRVTVVDVATDAVFTEPARRVILAAGSRAAHSTPLRTENGCVGMVNAHLAEPAKALDSVQARTLDDIGAEAGAWIAWHRRTVVRDALHDLHRRASDRPAARGGR